MSLLALRRSFRVTRRRLAPLAAVLVLAGAVAAHHEALPDIPAMSGGIACLAVLATGFGAAVVLDAVLPIRHGSAVVTGPRPLELVAGLSRWSARDGPLFVVLGVFRC